MSTTTGIEWTDSTWSPLRVRVRTDAAQIAREKGYNSLVKIAEKMAARVGPHCEHVSPGCENCYAETNNHRCLPANGTGLPYDRRSRDLVEAFIDDKILLQPLLWGPVNIECSLCGSTGKNACRHDETHAIALTRPRRIFVENQSDLFGEWVTDDMLDRIFAVMALCPQHTFQVLTKRPERMLKYLSDAPGRLADAIERMRRDEPRRAVGPLPHLDGGELWFPLANVWLGVSAENQAAADERIPLLLQAPAAVRFISAEPVLGPVEINAHRYPSLWSQKLHWVICGGESGPHARPMHPDWARSLRNQCVAAGVPFFFKQWGEWQNGSEPGPRDRIVLNDGRVVQSADGVDQDARNRWNEFRTNMMARVGKKSAGALLDGREWKQFPEVRA